VRCVQLLAPAVALAVALGQASLRGAGPAASAPGETVWVEDSYAAFSQGRSMMAVRSFTWQRAAIYGSSISSI